MFEDDVKRISLLNKGLNRAKNLCKKSEDSKHLELVKNIEKKLFFLDKILIQKINCKKYVYKKDYDFLDELSKKICVYNEVKFNSIKFTHINYNNFILTIDDFNRIENLLSTDNFILTPSVTNFNFVLGYCLYDIEQKKSVLHFTDKNLPNEINFQMISNLILGERNVDLANQNGIELFEKE